MYLAFAMNRYCSGNMNLLQFLLAALAIGLTLHSPAAGLQRLPKESSLQPIRTHPLPGEQLLFPGVAETELPALDSVLPDPPRRRRRKHRGKARVQRRVEGRDLKDDEAIFEDAGDGFQEVRRIGRVRRKHKLKNRKKHQEDDSDEFTIPPFPEFASVLEPPSIRMKRECGPSRLFDPRGPDAEGPGTEWRPEKGRYLLLWCHVGKMSHRLACLRKHLLLAGLLRRTLILDDFHRAGIVPSRQWAQEGAAFSWALAFNATMANECAGRQVVVSLAEARGGRDAEPEEGTVEQGKRGRKRGRKMKKKGRAVGGEETEDPRRRLKEEGSGGEGSPQQKPGRERSKSTSFKRARIADRALARPTGLVGAERASAAVAGAAQPEEEAGREEEEGAAAAPLVIDAAVAWHANASLVLPRTVRIRRDLRFPPAVLAARLTHNATREAILAAFAPHRDARVLVVGDLFFALWEVPDAPQLLPPAPQGDLPFARVAGCPSPFLLQPHERITRLGRGVWRSITENFGPYVAVHWEVRGGISSPLLCADASSSPACNLTTAEMSGFLWRQLSLLDIRNVFLITDMTDLEVRAGKGAVERLWAAHAAPSWVIKVGHFAAVLALPPPGQIRHLWYGLWEVGANSIRFILPRSFHARILRKYARNSLQAAELVSMNVAARADHFFGTFGSPFSLEVQRQRYLLGQAKCRDSALGDDFLAPLNATLRPPLSFVDLQAITL